MKHYALFSSVIMMALVLSITATAQELKRQNVTVTDKSNSVVLDNGIVSLEIGKRNGNPLKLMYKGASILGDKCYLNWHTSLEDDDAGDKDNSRTFGKISRGVYSLYVDPASNGGEMADVCVAQKRLEDAPPFDVELHYVLRRGDSGFYNYVIFNHPKGYPAGVLGGARMLYMANEKVFDFITIDDARRRFAPPPGTPFKSLGPKESHLITDGPFKGVIEDKYHDFADAGEHFVHGWEGSQSRMGCWVVYGSNEDVNGGPTKQYNTAHCPQVLMKILSCGHYGSAAVTVGTEQWQKIYGPWMVYVNSDGDRDQLWADAKQKAAAERAAWPYAWLHQPLYPLAAERGTVQGQLRLADPQAPSASAANAWVGLADPKPDWQQQAAGYQFWVRADKDGAFTIPSVRPGDYTLYAFVDGVMDEFRHDKVSVAAGQTVNLGEMQWTPVRFGRQLWQIGTPDRTATEFRHGDDYREWGLWLKYPEEFPNDVNFVVGQSKEPTDWNFAQCTVQKNGDWVGTTWNVQFDLADAPKGAATLRIALAAAHKIALHVSVNGKVVGTKRFDTDDAMIRAGIHGQYSLWNLRFDASLLKAGRNTISLDQQGGRSQQRNAMYDCIRLELAEPAAQ